MSQDFIEITQLVNHLSQRDFVRLKLYINEKFEKLKKENPKKINNIVYAVKNPDKVKDSVNKYRRKSKKETHSNTNQESSEKSKNQTSKTNTKSIDCNLSISEHSSLTQLSI